MCRFGAYVRNHFHEFEIIMKKRFCAFYTNIELLEKISFWSYYQFFANSNAYAQKRINFKTFTKSKIYCFASIYQSADTRTEPVNVNLWFFPLATSPSHCVFLM
jgi:hypothetical protein